MDRFSFSLSEKTDLRLENLSQEAHHRLNSSLPAQVPSQAVRAMKSPKKLCQICGCQRRRGRRGQRASKIAKSARAALSIEAPSLSSSTTGRYRAVLLCPRSLASTCLIDGLISRSSRGPLVFFGCSGSLISLQCWSVPLVQSSFLWGGRMPLSKR